MNVANEIFFHLMERIQRFADKEKIHLKPGWWFRRITYDERSVWRFYLETRCYERSDPLFAVEYLTDKDFKELAKGDKDVT